MKRSGPLNRYTELHRHERMKRISDKRRAKLAGRRLVKALVFRRAGGRCEARIDGVCSGIAQHPHHLQLESGGGGDWNEWPIDLRVREFPEVRA